MRGSGTVVSGAFENEDGRVLRRYHDDVILGVSANVASDHGQAEISPGANIRPDRMWSIERVRAAAAAVAVPDQVSTARCVHNGRHVLVTITIYIQHQYVAGTHSGGRDLMLRPLNAFVCC